jgi:outer membrane protein assembly factor BamB
MLNCLRPLAIALLAIESLMAADWPQFRGPTGDGVSKATGVPTEWSSTENVAWKQAIPGSGWSSPVLSKGRLYITAAVEGEDETVSLRALCLDAADGRIVWDVEVMQPNKEAAKQVHSKNSMASPTPIVDGERLYVHFGHMGTAALDLEGNVLWQQTALSYRPMHGNGGSPALAGDKLVFSCDGLQEPFVAALDRENGEVRWKQSRNSGATRKARDLAGDLRGRLFGGAAACFGAWPGVHQHWIQRAAAHGD